MTTNRLDKIERSKPAFDFYREKQIWYGPNGIGKSALAAELDDTIFFATERGQSKLEVFKEDIDSWEKFILCSSSFADSKFKLCVIDNLQCLHSLYLKWFLSKHNVPHETMGNLGFGKGSAMLARGFADEFLVLQNTGKGYILITTDALIELGDKQFHTRPEIFEDSKNALWTATVGVCDLVLYFNKELRPDDAGNIGLQRMIHSQATNEYLAKARWPLYDDKLMPCPDIQLIEGNPRKSLMRLVKAYNNGAKVFDAQVQAKITKEQPK
jgi:hypothetical protein